MNELFKGIVGDTKEGDFDSGLYETLLVLGFPVDLCYDQEESDEQHVEETL